MEEFVFAEELDDVAMGESGEKKFVVDEELDDVSTMRMNWKDLRKWIWLGLGRQHLLSWSSMIKKL